MTVLGEPQPLSLDELTRRSDLVVEAQVLWLRTYINPSDTAVLTDYQIQLTRVLAGGVSTGGTKQPGNVAALVLRTLGGEVVRDDVTIRTENHDLATLKEHVPYLLFLKRFEQDAYAIYNTGVFELANGGVRPLGRDGTFRGFPRTYTEIVAQIVTAAGRK